MPDVRRMLEAVYDFEQNDLTSWLERIREAATPALQGALGVILEVHRFHDDGKPDFVAVTPKQLVTPAIIASASRPAVVAKILAMPPVAFAATLIDDGAELALPAMLADGFVTEAPQDVFIVNGSDDGVGLTITALLPTAGSMTAPARAAWTRISAHLAAAARLRLRGLPKSQRPVVDGVATSPPPDNSLRDARRKAARAVDSVRGKKVKDPEEALAIWRVLAEGRWTIADDFDRAGRRYIVAYDDTPVPRASLPQLTLAERQAVCFAALGHSNKHIGYELGIAPSTVATRLSSAMKKLGVTTRAALINAVQARAFAP